MQFINQALSLSGPFTLEELSGFDDFTEESLEESGLFFWTYDNDGSRSFISKENYFDGSHFCIHLAKEEIVGAYLVATGRFIPFTQKMPKLVVGGKELPLIKRCIQASCLEKVLSLDKGQSLLQVFAEQSGRTRYTLQALNTEEIDVYDLSSIKEDLHNGAHLELELSEEGLNGKLIQSDAIELAKVQKWCELMEKSFLGVLKEFGPFYDLSQQLELAYFYGPSLLLTSPSLALRDFLKLSRKLDIYDFIFRRTLWLSGENPLESSFSSEEARKVKRCLSSKIEVNPAYYAFIPEASRDIFECSESYEIPNSELNEELRRSVLRSVLWLINSQDKLETSDLPIEELLLFDVVYSDLQSLCEVYRTLPVDKAAIQDFVEAVELNSKMLKEVCELLQIYYLSSSFN